MFHPRSLALALTRHAHALVVLQVSRKPLVCRADGFIGSTTNLVCSAVSPPSSCVQQPGSLHSTVITTAEMQQASVGVCSQADGLGGKITD